ncbi:MAG: class I SAM-dependent methyltransferase [Acidimicrobiia bacterium]|nr:class I SAM-dependent methyltransferase [Acidimicrobiia bacterium]
MTDNLGAYERSAEVYDAVYTQMINYPEHAQKIYRIIDDRVPGAETVLDVACGTGQYTQYLARRFAVTGLDIQPSMLQIARRRLGDDVPLVEGDMTDFDLGRRFDAVVCLFSSIAYVHTPEAFRATIANLAKHTVDGGVCIVEPWIEPQAWEDGRLHMMTVDKDDLKVGRITSSEPREGHRVLMNWAFAVGRPDGDVETYTETHLTGLFTHDEYGEAFEAAGLEATFDPEGLIGRGLWVAVKQT